MATVTHAELLEVADLDAAGVLAAATGAVRARRLAEVDDLVVLAQWAHLHGADPTKGPDGDYARRVRNVLVDVGGEGTPQVQDFCLGEIAMARATGVMATRNAIADVLDLVHRLPRVWRACLTGEAEVWVARKVAKLSRHLPFTVIAVVDAAVAPMMGTEAAARIIDVAEAKIIEADPDLHLQRTEQERTRRYVAVSRADEAGLKTVIARISAGDAAWVDATITRVAEILSAQHPELTRDQARAQAFGRLARPGDLLQLLLEHTDQTLDLDDLDGNRALAFPADLLDALRAADWSCLTPKTTLYVHLHEAVLQGAPGVARAEEIGPVALEHLAELLAGTQVSVKPVIDLTDRIKHTAYEHPVTLKERVHLMSGGDYWPYAVGTGRSVEYDHPTPYRLLDHGGPPGQTGTHNSGPLGRRHHKWKTHAGYRSRQSGPGRYVWTTPNGLAFLVDHHGTRPIDPTRARAFIDAPPGLEVYLAPFEVTVELERN